MLCCSVLVLWSCPGLGASLELSVPKHRAGESRVMVWEVVGVSSGRVGVVGEVCLVLMACPRPCRAVRTRWCRAPCAAWGHGLRPGLGARARLRCCSCPVVTPRATAG